MDESLQSTLPQQERERGREDCLFQFIMRCDRAPDRDFPEPLTFDLFWKSKDKQTITTAKLMINEDSGCKKLQYTMQPN